MAASKRGLGRGLDALFSEAPIEIPDEEKSQRSEQREEKKDSKKPEETGVLYIDINDIKPNEHQPRKTFDEEKLQELADSILQHGIIQPVVLRKADQGYEIVAGERRWRAARKAGLKKIPCVLKELTDEQNMLIAIIENMQREDLNPIEEAEGLNRMIDIYGLTQEQVSKGVGKSRPYITNSLRLLKLPEEIRELTRDGNLSAGHARALAGIKDKDEQIKAAKKVVKEGLSVRAVEKLAKGTETRKKSAKPKKDADAVRVEEDLKQALGTKVKLVVNEGNKGKIEIDYYSREELERLIELLKTLSK